MSKAVIIFIFFTIQSSYFVFGQNMTSGGAGDGVFYLKPMSSTSPNALKRGSYVGPHVLGDEVTRKLNLFEKEYVFYKKTSGAYPVEEMVVLKSAIYKKTREFNTYITKQYEEGNISETDAVSRLSTVLDISVKLLDFDTRKVEKEVKKLEPAVFEEYLKKLTFAG